MEKYKEHSNKILKLLEDIFGWLPLGTVINNKIFVTHGGISNITDLEIINRIDRHKVGHILVIYMQLFFAYVPFILTVQSIKFCMVRGCSCFCGASRQQNLTVCTPLKLRKSLYLYDRLLTLQCCSLWSIYRAHHKNKGTPFFEMYELFF